MMRLLSHVDCSFSQPLWWEECVSWSVLLCSLHSHRLSVSRTGVGKLGVLCLLPSGCSHSPDGPRGVPVCRLALPCSGSSPGTRSSAVALLAPFSVLRNCCSVECLSLPSQFPGGRKYSFPKGVHHSWCAGEETSSSGLRGSWGCCLSGVSALGSDRWLLRAWPGPHVIPLGCWQSPSADRRQWAEESCKNPFDLLC